MTTCYSSQVDYFTLYQQNLGVRLLFLQRR
jgi:hypothetical protein